MIDKSNTYHLPFIEFILPYLPLRHCIMPSSNDLSTTALWAHPLLQPTQSRGGSFHEGAVSFITSNTTCSLCNIKLCLHPNLLGLRWFFDRSLWKRLHWGRSKCHGPFPGSWNQLAWCRGRCWISSALQASLWSAGSLSHSGGATGRGLWLPGSIWPIGLLRRPYCHIFYEDRHRSGGHGRSPASSEKLFPSFWALRFISPRRLVRCCRCNRSSSPETQYWWSALCHFWVEYRCTFAGVAQS